jgi:predicted GTPase
VCAARTGCGKSQTARYVAKHLRELPGIRVGVVRHPMPYGELAAERVLRFAKSADLRQAHCTLEEHEEYEAHLEAGNLVFAGVDYGAVLAAAEAEADVLVWDGGNNDFSFLAPDLAIAVVDALRPDQIDTHHPGETVVRMADVVVVNKVDATRFEDTERALDGVRRVNPRARVVLAASPIKLSEPALVRGRCVLVVEDGPTLTHGGMSYGAGYTAALEGGASDVIDPRTCASPAVAELYRLYPHIGCVLPCVGYTPDQLTDLAETIERAPCDVVVSAAPMDIAARLGVKKPVVRARYEYADTGEPTLKAVIREFATARLRPAKACSVA